MLLQDSPTRADTLFADAMEYDEDYDSLAGNLNGPTSSWLETPKDSAANKTFNQRRRLEVYSDGSENGLGSSLNGNSNLTLEDGPSMKQFSPAWGELLNGHRPNTDGHASNMAVPDSWEALAPEKRNLDRQAHS